MEITSPANPRVKQLVALRRRRARDESGVTLVEGWAEIELALAAGVRPQSLYYCPDLSSPNDHDLRERARDLGADVIQLSRPVFEKASYREGPDGWLAVVPAVDTRLARLDPGPRPLVLACAGLEKPGNLGAILRTADAAGADGVVIPERRAAGVTAIVTKTSAGASEHLPIAKVTNIARTLEELKAQNLWMVGLDERGEQSYDSLDYNMDCAIVLGAEGKGLHDLVARKCDFLVSIPMLGKVPSLNVSVAAGVMLYEIVRQRRKKSA